MPFQLRRGAPAALALAICAAAAFAQAASLPGTDIYLATFSERSGSPAIGAAYNVTERPGYDNQPWFIDGASFFYAGAVDTSGSTDIFRYDIPTASLTRITDTPESEYSPMLTPDGKHISVVRVEAEGVQRLWRFDRDGTHPRLIAADVDSVGYYAWRDEHTVVVFIVGAPHRLCVVDTDSGTETPVALDVGRSIHRIPGSDDISFLQRRADVWMLMRLDADTGRVFPIAEALEDSQDCAWTPNGDVLMGREGKVYLLERDRGGWTPLVSFGDPGLRPLTRLAVDPTARWLAIVGADAQQPAEH